MDIGGYLLYDKLIIKLFGTYYYSLIVLMYHIFVKYIVSLHKVDIKSLSGSTGGKGWTSIMYLLATSVKICPNN